MQKFLKIANHITAYIPLFALASFFTLFVQVALKVENKMFFRELTGWLFVSSFIFFSPVTIILFCIRRFIYKEKMSAIFIFWGFTGTLLIYLLFFNVGNVLAYVVG